MVGLQFIYIITLGCIGFYVNGDCNGTWEFILLQPTYT